MFGARRLRRAVQQGEILDSDDPCGQGVVDQGGAPIGGVGARSSAHALDTDAVELVADVVQLAAETGQGPTQPGGRVGVARQVHRAAAGAPEPGLGQCQDRQVLTWRQGRGTVSRIS